MSRFNVSRMKFIDVSHCSRVFFPRVLRSTKFSLSKFCVSKLYVSVLCASVLSSSVLYATEIDPWLPAFSQMNQGGVGLVQMPTARFNQEGTLATNYQDSEEYRYWTTSLQLFPWLETTMRYTDVRTRLYSNDPGFSGDQTLKDKGIDAKLRLWSESRYIPQLAVGVRDFGGTGLFESEFVVLSKRWENIDFHLGIGWGYLGRNGNISNPFCKLADSYCVRPLADNGEGGSIDYQQFFKGPAALYGGIEYQTPWQPLRLKLEYDGNNYKQDPAGQLAQKTHINLAAIYRVSENFDINANYLRGNTFGFGLNYRFNLHTASQVKIFDAPRIVPDVLKAPDTKIDRFDISTKITTQAGFRINKYWLTDHEIIIEGNNVGFRQEEEFINRIGRVLAAELPGRITTYRIREMGGALPMVEIVIDAAQFVEYARRDNINTKIMDSVTRVEPEEIATEDWQLRVKSDGYYTSADTYFIHSFGNPEKFFMYQGGAMLSAGYVFDSAWSLNTSVRATLLTNFDDFNFKVDAIDTGVPRVRTYVREYVTRNDINVETLFAGWNDAIAKNWFAAGYAGMLETMYGGIGGEVLYRPIDSRFAFGVDLNYVQQRDYDSYLDFFDYKVLTGEANVYWKPEFADDLHFKVGLGRYLAKDIGVNVEFSKRFDSGIVVGAFATKTDMSAEEYGEGSFSKGFYINIPFDLFMLRPSIGQARIPWVPIGRDGGQPVIRPIQLYGLTESRSPFIK